MRAHNANKEAITAAWIVGDHSGCKVEPVVRGLAATFIVKGTFKLTHGNAASRWPASPDYPSGDVQFNGGRAGLAYATDFAPVKAKGEFLVKATAHPPRNDATMFGVRARVGSLQKSLTIFGPREWNDSLLGSRPGQPSICGPLPLTYASAWGGSEYLANPLGLGREGNSMPQVELPGALVRARNAEVEPAGFAPMPPDWPQRSGKLGTYNNEWLAERWPWFPTDFDYSFYNAAPRGQVLDGFFRGDEQLEFENLHSKVPIFEAGLPGLRARCLVEQVGNWQPDLRATERAVNFVDVPLFLDTIFADLDEEKLVLVWRGCHPVRSLKLRDIEKVLFLVEPLDQPLALDECRAKLQNGLFPSPVPAEPRGSTPTAAEINRIVNARSAEVMAEVVAARKAMLTELTGLADRERSRAAEIEPVMEKARTEMKSVPSGVLANPATLSTQQAAGHIGEIATKLSGTKGVPGDAIAQMKLQSDVTADIADVEAQQKIAEEELRAAADESERAIDAAVAETMPPLLRTVPLRDDGSIDLEACRRDQLRRVDGRGVDFSGLDLSGIDFSGSQFSGSIFQNCRMEGANLTHCEISGANFTNASLARATIDNVDFSDAIVSKVNWQGCSVFRTRFCGLPLTDADFSDVRGLYADFSGAKLAGATFRGAALAKALFTGADVNRANFSRASLFYADFRECHGSGAVFDEADLRCLRGGDGANFAGASFQRTAADRSVWERAQLEGASFRFARLNDARFSEAQLSRANLDRSHASRATFDDANLEGAVLANANLLRANFDRANLTSAVLDGSNLFEAGFWNAILEKATWHYANVRRTRLAL